MITPEDRKPVPAKRVARDSLLYRMARVIALSHGYSSAASVRRYIPWARQQLEEMRRVDEPAWNRANHQAWLNNRCTTEHNPEEVWPLMLEEISKGIEI